MNNEIIIGVLAAVVIAVICVAVVMTLKLRKLEKRLLAQDDIVSQNQESIRALFSGAAGVGDHLMRVEHLMKRVAERQDQLDIKDSSSYSYDHAIKLIQGGADYEEVIAQCGLVREEADLLVQMYRYEQAS